MKVGLCEIVLLYYGVECSVLSTVTIVPCSVQGSALQCSAGQSIYASLKQTNSAVKCSGGDKAIRQVKIFSTSAV